MYGDIGRVFEFAEKERPNHRLERLRVVPVWERIVVSVRSGVEVADHPDRVSRLFKDFFGLFRQQQPSARKGIGIFESIIGS